MKLPLEGKACHRKGWQKPEFKWDGPRRPGETNTGRRLDGLVVVDCDSAEAVGWWGTNGPPTPYVTQGNPNRRSYWYRLPAGMTAEARGWWIPETGERAGEIKSGHGHYCVIPDSLHDSPDDCEECKTNGPHPYLWVGEGGAPTKLELMPEITEAQLPTRPDRDSKSVMFDANTPSRHMNLWNTARSMANRGQSEAAILAALKVQRDEYSPKARVIEDEELARIARDAISKPDRIGWIPEDEYRIELVPGGRSVAQEAPLVASGISEGLEETEDGGEAPEGFDKVPTFPTQTLPDWLREYVEALAESTQTPPDLAGMVVLSALSTICAKRFTVRRKSDWVEPVNIYAVCALAPSERKSPVFTPTLKILHEIEEELDLLTRSNRRMTQNRRRRLEGLVKAAEKDLNEQTPGTFEENVAYTKLDELQEQLEATPEQFPPRLTADDITPEKLGILLAQHGERIALLSDEGDIFNQIAGRYNQSQPNYDLLLKGYPNSPKRVDRVGRDSIHLKAPSLTIGITTQPSVIQELGRRPDFRGTGLLARFMYFVPNGRIGSRQPDAPCVPNQIKERYRDQLVSLALDIFGRDLVELHLELEASNSFLDFEWETERQMGTDGSLDSLSDWGGKLCGHVLRIAGLLHIAQHHTNAGSVAVSFETMDSAINIGRYLIAHAKAAFALLGQDNQTTDDAKFLLARLEGWAKAGDRRGTHITTRELERTDQRNRFKGPVGKTRAAAGVRELVDRSILLPLPQSGQKGLTYQVRLPSLRDKVRDSEGGLS